MWVCTVCTFENNAKSFKCGVCALPRHATTGNATSWWQCPNCCQLNKERMARCNLCLREKPAELKNGVEIEQESHTETSPGTERDGSTHHRMEQQERESSSVYGRAHVHTHTGLQDQENEMNGSISSTVEEENGETEQRTENKSSWSCGRLYKTAVQAVTPYLPQFSTPQPSVSETNSESGDKTSVSSQPHSTSRPVSGHFPEFSVEDLRLDSCVDESDSEQWSGQDPFYLDWSTVAIGDDLSGSDTDLMARSAENASPPLTDSEPEQPETQLTDEEDAHRTQEDLDNTQAVGEIKNTTQATDAEADEEDLEFPDQECRLVLVGKTGNGKSSLGNTLLGLNRFESRHDFASTTTRCQRHNTVRFGVHLEVVDTPGLFDTEIDRESIIREIAKCFGMVAPGLHSIVLVLRIGVKFTHEENSAVEEVYKLFGLHLLRFLVVVFTHGDRLQNCGDGGKEDALKAMLDSAPEKLRELINHANNRYVVFDNTADEATKRQQVRQLLVTVKNLLAVNGGQPFTSHTLRDVELCMRNRESELRSLYEGNPGGGRREAEERTVDSFHYRDIAREELAQERPLLDVVKSQVLPVLVPVLRDVFRTLVLTSVKHGRCSLQ